MDQTSQISSALNWRYAVKKFDPHKKIANKTWQILQEALILTPSSYGLQPWKFYIITDAELKQKLTTCSWGQKQVADCSHLVVFCIKQSIDENYIQHFIDSTAAARNVVPSSLDGYKKVMMSDLMHGSRASQIKEWAARQVYIALGNFMTVAAMLEVDTCPLEGIQPAEYDSLLNLTSTGYQTVVACAAGYRSIDDKYQTAKKVRFSASELIVNI